ncbi:host attachment protein [Cognatiyoonia sp. IB215182]|uniref:host attachment protein n=1 Tax=Cognatiyoonia sp. IB215182 TaxID=3097353 RepID=UPI002A0CF95E|nr:host attachment protein [Cognatiyoonia sp. IB215182]MDX8354984.1 host attachment protein [Cognatiyoonia sp. IB215182]
MKPIKTWIVLADAGQVRIAVNEGQGKGIYGHSTPDLEPRPVTALSDEPGVTHAPAGPNRGGISDPDLKAQAMQGFAQDIARYLADALSQDEYHRLILIAPAAMLGALRQALTPPLRAVLHAEISKDLTQLPLDALPDHLADVLVV